MPGLLTETDGVGYRGAGLQHDLAVRTQGTRHALRAGAVHVGVRHVGAGDTARVLPGTAGLHRPEPWGTDLTPLTPRRLLIPVEVGGTFTHRVVSSVTRRHHLHVGTTAGAVQTLLGV